MITHIPYEQLRLSEENVRKTDRDAEVESLAADIEARGLKQNLVVITVADFDDDNPAYEVVAGGRRLQALQLLARRGALPASLGFGIPCLIEDSEQAVETSLSENLHRVAMNPADEFLAFRTVIDQQSLAGNDGEEAIKYCARRFGVTEQHVRGRLRLADLADVVLEALRSNEITLGSAKAYGSVSDRELQEAVFAKQAKSTWKPHDPDAVRSALKNKAYPSDGGIIKLIGLDAYIARGGRTEVDLFTLDAPTLCFDTKLADLMVEEAFKKQASKIAKKHKADNVMLGSSSWQCGAPKHWPTTYLGGTDTQRINKVVGEMRQHNPEAKIWLFAYVGDDGTFEIGSYAYSEIPKPEKGDDEGSSSGGGFDHAEHSRQQEERRIAMHLLYEQLRAALPKTKDTPFEGRLFLKRAPAWPRAQQAEGGLLFEIEVFISHEELEAVKEQAQAAVEEAYARNAAEEAEREAKREAEKAAKAEMEQAMLANPPAVIETDSGETMFRHEDGSYHDVRPDEDPDDAEYQCEDIADAVECGIRQCWPTIEAYDAEVEAENADAEAEDADADEESVG